MDQGALCLIQERRAVLDRAPFCWVAPEVGLTQIQQGYSGSQAGVNLAAFDAFETQEAPLRAMTENPKNRGFGSCAPKRGMGRQPHSRERVGEV